MKSKTKKSRQKSKLDLHLAEIVDKFIAEGLTSQSEVAASRTLASSLVNAGLLPQPAALAGGIDAQTFILDIGGKGCEAGAQLGGIFVNTLVPAIGCFGAPVVLALLNFLVGQLCLAKVCPGQLKCPRRCPCAYDPAANLALYRCGKTVEIGILLPPPDTWNCHCKYSD